MSSEEYDYIVVGAGSAGCVLADRLTACGRYKTLLIEAGGTDKRFWIKTPLGYAKTFNNPQMNWCYTASADPGLNGRTAFWPRGRVLGGSSSINAMAYMRGLPRDFNDWEQAGATGWSWKTVKKIYETLETQSELNNRGQRQSIGQGPVWISDISDQMHPFTQHFMAGAQEMGWPVVNNLNSDQTEGMMKIRSTVRNGRRWSSADAFLRPALRRHNLRVVTGALVEKVLIKNGRASGVQYQIGDHVIKATANSEIILSAGAINSPQLLQLSGVGPKMLLSSLGIRVECDLSQVGQGLQDHLGISHYFHAKEATLNNKLGNWFGKMWAGAQYMMIRRGPLSVPVNQVSGFIRSHDGLGAPDLQIYCNPMSYKTNADGQTRIDSRAGFLLCAQPCRPTSCGEICISSSNPNKSPEIKPNSLSTSYDQMMAVKAGKVLQELANTSSIRAVTEERIAPDIINMDDNELLENFRERSGTIFHPTSTCKMGQTAQDSVLDSRLRVHGVRGLRVIDASAFPNLTSGNTNAPVMMLAARGADLIMQDANNPF